MKLPELLKPRTNLEERTKDLQEGRIIKSKQEPFVYETYKVGYQHLPLERIRGCDFPDNSLEAVDFTYENPKQDRFSVSYEPYTLTNTEKKFSFIVRLKRKKGLINRLKYHFLLTSFLSELMQHVYNKKLILTPRIYTNDINKYSFFLRKDPITLEDLNNFFNRLDQKDTQIRIQRIIFKGVTKEQIKESCMEDYKFLQRVSRAPR